MAQPLTEGQTEGESCRITPSSVRHHLHSRGRGCLKELATRRWRFVGQDRRMCSRPEQERLSSSRQAQKPFFLGGGHSLFYQVLTDWRPPNQECGHTNVTPQMLQQQNVLYYGISGARLCHAERLYLYGYHLWYYR